MSTTKTSVCPVALTFFYVFSHTGFLFHLQSAVPMHVIQIHLTTHLSTLQQQESIW